jgi:hypothetical protein
VDVSGFISDVQAAASALGLPDEFTAEASIDVDVVGMWVQLGGAQPAIEHALMSRYNQLSQQQQHCASPTAMQEVLRHMGFNAADLDRMFKEYEELGRDILDCVMHMGVCGVADTLLGRAFTWPTPTYGKLNSLQSIGDTATLQRRNRGRDAAVLMQLTTASSLRSSTIALADSSSSSSTSSLKNSVLPCVLYHGTTEAAAASIIDDGLTLQSRTRLDFTPQSAFYLTADISDAIAWAVAKAATNTRGLPHDRAAVVQFVTTADAFAAVAVCHVSADSHTELWQQLVVASVRGYSVQRQFYNDVTDIEVPDVVLGIDSADVVSGDQFAAPQSSAMRHWSDDMCDTAVHTVRPHVRRQ